MNLLSRAKKKDVSILKDSNVDKAVDSDGWTPLHELAYKGVKEVLSHPSVDKVKDRWELAPIQWLAEKETKKTWNHPAIDKIKDRCGRTPLHILARNGVKDVLNHSSVDKVKDHSGETPLHWLTYRKCLTKKDLKKRFPWYKKEIKNIEEAVKEIVNTPVSVKFILED